MPSRVIKKTRPAKSQAAGAAAVGSAEHVAARKKDTLGPDVEPASVKAGSSVGGKRKTGVEDGIVDSEHHPVKKAKTITALGDAAVEPAKTESKSARMNRKTAKDGLAAVPAIINQAPTDRLTVLVFGAGIEGYFRGSGIPCFAPSKAAAELEGSKTFAKAFMKKYSIPTAGHQSFDSYDSVLAHLQGLDRQRRIVIKVDGLAAGKGVVLPASYEEAQQALADMMLRGKFGSAAQSVVIEDYLEGDEISVLTLSDGKTSITLPPGQEHKRIFEGNTGPNTGGMGVYAPVPFVSKEQMAEIDRTILQPTLQGMKEEGRDFVGMLFTGIMVTPSGPKVLEYNVRFGDPETQTMMMLVTNDDFASVLLACAEGRLHDTPGIRASNRVQ